MAISAQSNLQTNSGAQEDKNILPSSTQNKQDDKKALNSPAPRQSKLKSAKQNVTTDGLKSVKVEKKNGSILVTKKFSDGKVTKSKK